MNERNEYNSKIRAGYAKAIRHYAGTGQHALAIEVNANYQWRQLISRRAFEAVRAWLKKGATH